MIKPIQIKIEGIDATRKKEIGTHISKYQKEIGKYLTDCLTPCLNPVELSKFSVNITITIPNR